ncbi:hypothetical protein [Achromobacter xylosoxidans]
MQWFIAAPFFSKQQPQVSMMSGDMNMGFDPNQPSRCRTTAGAQFQVARRQQEGGEHGDRLEIDRAPAGTGALQVAMVPARTPSSMADDIRP